MLLLVCALMGCFTFISLGQIQTTDFTFNFTTLGFFSEGNPTNGTQPVDVSTWWYFAISLTSAILPLIAIFCFKNLRLQRRLCLVEVLFILAVAAVGAILGYTVIDGTIGWSSIIIAPLLAFILTVWAYRLIAADAKKIASANRFY